MTRAKRKPLSPEEKQERGRKRLERAERELTRAWYLVLKSVMQAKANDRAEATARAMIDKEKTEALFGAQPKPEAAPS